MPEIDVTEFSYDERGAADSELQTPESSSTAHI